MPKLRMRWKAGAARQSATITEQFPSGRVREKYTRVLVYIRPTSGAMKYFVDKALELLCVFPTSNPDTGKPIPVHDDIHTFIGEDGKEKTVRTILAYEILIPYAAMLQFDTLVSIGKSPMMTDVQYREANKEKPILDYHYIGAEKIRNGMGKLSGMQAANRPMLDDAIGQDTMVQHGKPLIKPSPIVKPVDCGHNIDAKSKYRTQRDTTVKPGAQSTVLTTREIDENGNTVHTTATPIRLGKTVKKVKQLEARKYTDEHYNEVMQRCELHAIEDAKIARYNLWFAYCGKHGHSYDRP